MKIRMTVVAAFAAVAWGQAPAGPPPVDEVKAYLTLTDSQIQGLAQLRQQEAQALLSVRKTIVEKERALQEKLSSGITDAAALGALLLEIESLRKQIAQTETSFRNQSVNLLTADQKTKLKALEDAAKLRPAIDQAMMLNLLAPPSLRAAGGRVPLRRFEPGGGPGGGPAPAGTPERPGAMRLRRAPAN